MEQMNLVRAVTKLAEASHAFTDVDLEQPWQWRAHGEGVRFALIGTYHELRELAVEVRQERTFEGPPLTVAQQASAAYHEAYRELQALLIGVDDEQYDRLPAPMEWPLRKVLAHLVRSERKFYTLVHYGLRRQRSVEELPLQFPPDEVDRILGSSAQFEKLFEEETPQKLLAYYEDLHQRALRTFVAISDEEVQGPSLWWEGEAYSLQYRLHRFDAHLRQHTIQAEKTLEAIGHSFNEAKRLLRLVYRTLAEVEVAVFGADELALERRQALAQTIADRAEAVVTAVAQAQEMVQAVQRGDDQVVERLLAANPKLCNAVNDQLVPAVLNAVYWGHGEIAEMLADASEWLTIWSAAALGRQADVEAEYAEWPGLVNQFSRDGFTPLQLACFFGHESLALWLLEHGADVNAVARNRQKIQPIHATAANGNLTVLAALLERGADPNARQEKDFVALHEAALNGNRAMAELLLASGANVDAKDAAGRTPVDLAREAGHDELIRLLQSRRVEAGDGTG